MGSGPSSHHSLISSPSQLCSGHIDLSLVLELHHFCPFCLESPFSGLPPQMVLPLLRPARPGIPLEGAGCTKPVRPTAALGRSRSPGGVRGWAELWPWQKGAHHSWQPGFTLDKSRHPEQLTLDYTAQGQINGIWQSIKGNKISQRKMHLK